MSNQCLEHQDTTGRDCRLGAGLRIAVDALTFLRTTKEPTDDSLTASPFSKVSVISFSTSPTKAEHYERDKFILS
jgi:hypothetical protein